MTKEQITQILIDNSEHILDYLDNDRIAVEKEDFSDVADAILKLCEVNHTLMIKKEAERREEYAHLKVQIAIERFIEIYWDGEDELTFEDVNKRLKLH